LLFGCGGSPGEEASPTPAISNATESQATPAEENPDVDTLACGELTFEDWESWTKINSDAQPSEGHGNKWVDIYVNDLSESTYRSAGSPYALCSVVLKASYFSADRGLLGGLAAMVKMPAGYDSQNGDWWYGSFDKSGVTTKDAGRIEECIACHRQAAATDFMFSKEVLEASAE
jgi:hypothetical protein